MAQVDYQFRSGVARITLSASPTGNALSAPLVAELRQAIGQAGGEPSCRVIALTAQGEDFCRGMDLEASATQDPWQCLAQARAFVDCLDMLCREPRPVIVAVQGKVTGGGLGLIAAGDLVLAARSTVFMLPEVVIGMIPALIAPFLLRRLTPGRLRYLALSSRGIGAEEAHLFGLVDEVAADTVDEALQRQVQRLLRSCPEAIQATKEYVERLAWQKREPQTALGLETFAAWMSRPATVEGLRTFAEGFAPPWFQRPE